MKFQQPKKGVDESERGLQESLRPETEEMMLDEHKFSGIFKNQFMQCGEVILKGFKNYLEKMKRQLWQEIFSRILIKKLGQWDFSSKGRQAFYFSFKEKKQNKTKLDHV